MSIAYNVSLALLGLEEDKLRRKGEQDGSIRWKGNACYIRFREWRADKDGNLRYAPTEKRIAGDFPRTARGEREALLAGHEQWVSKANAVNKAPAGLATVEQFYETRFQIDHIDHLKKNGRNFYRTIWGTHIKATLGPVQLKDVSRGIVQALISGQDCDRLVSSDHPAHSELH